MSDKFRSSRILQNIFEEDQLSDHPSDQHRQLPSDSNITDNYEIMDGHNIVEMLIELDQNNSVTLLINQDDDPYTLAKKFCYAHNIDPKIIKSLGNNIKQIQKSEFGENMDFSQLINKNQRKNDTESNKQNHLAYSNAMTVDSRCHYTKTNKSTNHKRNIINHENTFNEHPSSLSNCLSRTTVFDRLYNDSKRKHYHTREKSKDQILILKSSKKNLSRVSDQPQVRIYEKNTKLKEDTLKKNQTIRNYIESIHETNSHIPEINPVSRLIAEKLRDINCHPSSKSKEKFKRKNMAYFKEREQRELQECTFHPKILNKLSPGHPKSDRFHLLHQDHFMREDKLQTIKQNLEQNNQQHKIIINEISEKIVGDKSFEMRMKQYQANSKLNRNKILKDHYRDCKFQPQINKLKKHSSEQNSFMSSFDRLYNTSKSKEKTKNHSNPTNFTNKTSNKIYEQNKKNAFRYIFTLMDDDEDGYISSLKINILGFNVQILNLLAPLLCEMEDVDVELDQEEFVDSFDRLFKTFTINQKNLILNVYKNPLRKSTNEQQPSFHPSLNQKSLQMVRETRDPCHSLYQQGLQKEYEKQQKLAKLRELKTLLQMEQCTFQPNLFYHHL